MPACAITVLSLTLAWAVYRQGGVYTLEWDVCLLELALLALAWRLFQRREQAPPLDRLSQTLILAFGFLAVVQILPLPLPLLRILSPARADLLAAAVPILGAPHFSTLTATPLLTAEHLRRLGAYFLVFLLVRDLSWHWRRTPWLPAVPLILIAAAEAVLGLYQAFVLHTYAPSGTYVNHNHFAGFLEWSLPFATVYAVSRFRTRTGWPGALAALSLALLIAAAILESLSRMGAVASCSALLAVAALATARTNRRLLRWLAVPAALALLLAAAALLPSALTARFQASVFTPDLEWRVNVWRDTLHLSAAYPWFGAGLGSLESVFPKYQTVTPMFSIDFAHNDYLQILAELGIPAFLTGLIFFASLAFRNARAARTALLPERRWIALACFGSFIALFVHSSTDFNLYLPANAMLFAWIAGIAAVPPGKISPPQ